MKKEQRITMVWKCTSVVWKTQTGMKKLSWYENVSTKYETGSKSIKDFFLVWNEICGAWNEFFHTKSRFFILLVANFIPNGYEKIGYIFLMIAVLLSLCGPLILLLKVVIRPASITVSRVSKMMIPFICSCRNENQPKAIYPKGTSHHTRQFGGPSTNGMK